MKIARKRYIPHRILLIAVLSCFSAGVYAVDAIYRTCSDYDQTTINTEGVGSVVIVSQTDCGAVIRAVSEEGATFKKWSDGNTDNPRTISWNKDSKDEVSYQAIFYYTSSHCNSCGDYDLIDDTKKESGRGIIHINNDGPCYTLYAQAYDGYAFAQWSDGNAENPRTINIIDEDEVTYYATFTSYVNLGSITGKDLAKIDQWDFNSIGGEITVIAQAEYSLSSSEQNYATIFFDGKSAGSFSVRNENDWRKDDGVYKLTYNTLAYNADSLAGKKCHIVFKNSSCEPNGIMIDTIIPYLVTGTKTVSPLDPTGRETYGVHVLEGATANFSVDQSIAELDIYPGGKANIAAKVKATSVIMRADVRNSADPAGKKAVASELLVESGSLSASSLYYDCAVDLNDYYGFSLPGTVNTDAAKYRSGASIQDNFGLDWYNGYNRANGSRAWEIYDDGSATTSINIGTGYNFFALPETWKGHSQDVYGANIRFPLSTSYISSPQSDILVYTHSSEVNANKNWNLIGLPYMSSYQGPIYMLDEYKNVLEELNYIIYTDDNFRTYLDPVHPSDFVMKPVQAYFVQVVDGTMYLSFNTPVAGRTYAPRRGIKAVNDKLTAGIMLTQADNSDRAGILLGEKYTNDYDINADLAKMFGSNQGFALFMLSGSQELAYIALPPAEGNGVSETVIPLGYNKATMGQEMTFAFDEERYPSLRDDERIQALELIDYVEGTTTDLLQEPYTCTAYEKADNARFALAIRYTKTGANVTTGICDDVAASKVNDGIYDLMGRRVNADDARSLGAGVYIIMENGKARKEVIR